MPEHTSGQAEKGFAIFRGEVLYLRLSQPPQGGDLGGDTGQLAGVVPLLPLDPWVREEVGGIGLDHKPILWNPSGYLGQFFGVFITLLIYSRLVNVSNPRFENTLFLI